MLKIRKVAMQRYYAEKMENCFAVSFLVAVSQRIIKNMCTPGKRVYVKSVSRVRISVTPLRGRGLRSFCLCFLLCMVLFALYGFSSLNGEKMEKSLLSLR